MVMCWPAAQLEATKWLYTDLHEAKPFHNGHGDWSAKRSANFPFHYGDGVSFFMAPVDLGLGGDFLSQAEGTEDGAKPNDDQGGQN